MTSRARGRRSLVFLSTSCPLAKRYTQRLNRLVDEFAEDDVTVCGVFPNHEDSSTGISDHASGIGITFPIVKGPNLVFRGTRLNLRAICFGRVR